MADLELAQISRHFPTRGQPLEILKGVDLHMSGSDNLAVVGPSGSGKSTLLHIMGTLDSPTSGTLQLDGVNPLELSEEELARFRNSHIGFVFQDHHLLPQLSVLENVLVPAIALGRPDQDCLARADSLIQRVGLSDRRHHRPAELSGGERERVAVARSLIHQPRLLLADEPTGNLDASNARQVAELLLEIQAEQQMMLVVVTHSMELANMLQERKELDNGRLTSPEAS